MTSPSWLLLRDYGLLKNFLCWNVTRLHWKPPAYFKRHETKQRKSRPVNTSSRTLFCPSYFWWLPSAIIGAEITWVVTSIASSFILARRLCALKALPHVSCAGALTCEMHSGKTNILNFKVTRIVPEPCWVQTRPPKSTAASTTWGTDENIPKSESSSSALTSMEVPKLGNCWVLDVRAPFSNDKSCRCGRFEWHTK